MSLNRLFIDVGPFPLILGIGYVGHRLATYAEQNGVGVSREISSTLIWGAIGILLYIYEYWAQGRRDRYNNAIDEQAERDEKLAVEQKRHSMSLNLRLFINTTLLAVIVGIAYVGFLLELDAEQNGGGALRDNIGGGLIVVSIVGFVFVCELFADWFQDRLDNNLADEQAERDKKLEVERKRQLIISSLTVKDDLTGTVLANHDLQGIVLPGRDLTAANLTAANLSRAYLTRADLTEANLSRADFSAADLTRANLHKANLKQTNLSGADLTGADLTRANLHKANLKQTNLIGADLTGADLTGADLTGAILSEANLIGANLIGADLTGANLRQTNLSGTDLTEAVLSEVDPTKAVWDDSTVWPGDFKSPG